MSEDHRRYRELLGSFALGHLERDEATSVQAHLDGCRSCRAELDEIAAPVAALADVDLSLVLSPAAPPPHAAAALVAAVAAERRLRDRRRVRRTAVTALAAAAGLAAVLGLGYAAGRAQGPVTPKVPMETVALTAAVPGVDVLSAILVPHTWGVEVTFEAAGLTAGQTYRAAFRSADGTMTPAGEFVGVGARTLTCDMQSSVLRKDVTGFVVVDARGREVLRAPLPRQA